MMRTDYENSGFEALSPLTCHEIYSRNRTMKNTISYVSLECPYTLIKSIMKVSPFHL